MEVEMKIPELTYEELSEAVAYDPETGVFTWKISPSKQIRVGEVVGGWKTVRTSSGETKRYLYVTYANRSMIASRVAWLLHYKVWPETAVQFIDGDTANLKINNLRLAAFPTNKVSQDGRTTRKMSNDAQRHYGLKRYYKMSLSEYAEMYASQNGVCAICKKPETTEINGKVKPLSVDHNHATGDNRGLLCHSCNHLLGHAMENYDTLLGSIAYLYGHDKDKENVKEQLQEGVKNLMALFDS
jgi:hypothetical protein